MKYLSIVKSKDNYDYVHWFVTIKQEYIDDYKYRKNLKMGEKVQAYLDGESEEMVHAGKTYNISKSKFTSGGFPVYILSVDNVPKFFAYRYKTGNGQPTNLYVEPNFIADENIDLFESYGYTIKK